MYNISSHLIVGILFLTCLSKPCVSMFLTTAVKLWIRSLSNLLNNLKHGYVSAQQASLKAWNVLKTYLFDSFL